MIAEVTPVLTAPGSFTRTQEHPEGVFIVDAAAWRQSRYQVLVDVLARRIALEAAKRLGLQLLPLFARETGAGNREYNYNVGNLRPGVSPDPVGVPGWKGEYITRTHGRYRAYGSLQDGTEDFVQLLESNRYRGAFDYLQRTGDVQGFYEQLIRSGYYPADEAEIADARREYQSLYSRYVSIGISYVPSSPLWSLIGFGAVGAVSYWLWKVLGGR